MKSYSPKLKVSIVIPAYNMAAFLSETLDNILKQEYEPLQIIVVDDGSTDNTAAVVAEYLHDERVHYIYQTNAKTPVARNTGIKASDGEAIMFVDADDLLPEGAISILATALSQLDDRYCLVHGEMVRFEDKTWKEIGKTSFKEISNSRGRLLNTRVNILLTCLIRKQALVEAGMFHESMKTSSEDIDMVFRLSKIGLLKSINSTVYHYRVRPNSRSHIVAYDQIVAETKERRAMLQRVLKGENVLIRLQSWGTHYFWAAFDFHKHDKHLSQKLYLLSLLIYPFNLDALKLFRASLLGKLD